MKNIVTIFLLIISFALFNCNQSNEEKAKEAIKTYLNENLNDMSTYESVKFGQLDTTMILDLTGTSFEKKAKGFKFQMFHSYRLKNADGQKEIFKGYYLLDNNLKVISFSSYPNRLLKEARIQLPPMEYEDADTAAADTIAY